MVRRIIIHRKRHPCCVVRHLDGKPKQGRHHPDYRKRLSAQRDRPANHREVRGELRNPQRMTDQNVVRALFLLLGQESAPQFRRDAKHGQQIPRNHLSAQSEEIQALLLGLLASSRSLNAAKDALQKMGLSSSQQDLDQVAAGLIEELELRNTRPLDCDLLALFLDGKYVEFRDGDRLRPACIYLVIGLRRDGRKQVLSCLPRLGRENLEDWKTVLRGLLERGLRRVLFVVHDDFSGLLPITQSLFPSSDVQLCAVHMQRNAKTHLPKADAGEFQQRWRAIKSCWNLEFAHQQFEELCDRFTQTSSSFIAELRKKRPHYLAFLRFPESIRRSFSTTNAVEAINGQLEIMRRNSGGYFYSEDTLKLKLGLAISSHPLQHAHHTPHA